MVGFTWYADSLGPVKPWEAHTGRKRASVSPREGSRDGILMAGFLTRVEGSEKGEAERAEHCSR